jgi:hypothetical protein
MNKRQSGNYTPVHVIAFLALLTVFLVDFSSQFIQQALGQNTAVTNTNATVSNQTGRMLMPFVINVTRNTNATGTAAEYIVNVTRSGMTNLTAATQANHTGLEITPFLVDTLRNTNATSIAAQYVVNITGGANNKTR